MAGPKLSADLLAVEDDLETSNAFYGDQWAKVIKGTDIRAE